MCSVCAPSAAQLRDPHFCTVAQRSTVLRPAGFGKQHLRGFDTLEGSQCCSSVLSCTPNSALIQPVPPKCAQKNKKPTPAAALQGGAALVQAHSPPRQLQPCSAARPVACALFPASFTWRWRTGSSALDPCVQTWNSTPRETIPLEETRPTSRPSRDENC